MQSQSRRIKRISLGLQNPGFSSTKVSSRTPFASVGLSGYRRGRGNK